MRIVVKTTISFCISFQTYDWSGSHSCETWSLTLREERRQRVFEIRVLRRIFGPRMDEVTGEWRKTT
jgi:hypothetical protein